MTDGKLTRDMAITIADLLGLLRAYSGGVFRFQSDNEKIEHARELLEKFKEGSENEQPNACR